MARKTKVVILEDKNDYDNKGRKIIYKEWEPTKQIVEPIDPNYLVDTLDEKSPVTRAERKYFRMVGKLEAALKKNKISHHWEDCWFAVKTLRGGERYFWVDEDDWTYCYGTSEESTSYTEDLSVVEDVAEKLVAMQGVSLHQQPVEKLRKRVQLEINAMELELKNMQTQKFLRPVDAENVKEKILRQDAIDNNNKACFALSCVIRQMQEENKTRKELK